MLRASAKGGTHEVIYSFSYSASVTVDTPSTPRVASWNDEELSCGYSSDLREKYDSPEDLWEEIRISTPTRMRREASGKMIKASRHG